LRCGRRAYYVANSVNLASIALHARLGFVELSRDFWYPDVSFTGGEGVLFGITLRDQGHL
jgi:RimJ/RimL family protein N-acetyltransferase